MSTELQNIKEKLANTHIDDNSDNDMHIKNKIEMKSQIDNLKISVNNLKVTILVLVILSISLGLSVIYLVRRGPQIVYYEKYKSPSLTTDSLVIRKHKNDQFHDILLVTRGRDPFKDHLAFPGGFVDYDEDPLQGCVRELQEETNLIGENVELFTVRGNPKRDPRKHVVSIMYLVNVNENSVPKGADDAKEAKFYSLKDIYENYENKMAFDHYGVIKELVETKFKDIYKK